ncbi:MAG: hypothetical protein ACFBZ8_00955 [Opitutales bacterium]
MKKWIQLSLCAVLFTGADDLSAEEAAPEGEAAAALETRTRVIFEDDFETEASYEPEKILNATFKQYVDRSLYDGYPLKKWRLCWDYVYEGRWTQAFYVRHPNEGVMIQGGRSACNDNDGVPYRILADVEIPAEAIQYTITFRQLKKDNDPVHYLLGADANGVTEIDFGFMNQLPQSDVTTTDLYTRGILFGDHVLYRDKVRMNEWVDVKIEVDVVTKMVRWTLDGQLIGEAWAQTLPPGGYFGMYMCWERDTRFDDFKIEIVEPVP